MRYCGMEQEGRNMSECVVRMEIPVNCDKCDLRNGCKLYVDYSWSLSDCFPTRPKPNPLDRGCLIICQLPEGHGRLGDLDALADDVRSLWDYKTVDGIAATTVLNQTLTDIRNCPTIVPAEAERSET